MVTYNTYDAQKCLGVEAMRCFGSESEKIGGESSFFIVLQTIF